MYLGYVAKTKSGGTYVGITNNLPRRIREHKFRGPLSKENFYIIHEEVFADRHSASLWEIEKIAELGGPENLMNTSFGGHGGRRRIVTQKERDHLSQMAVDRQKSPEFRARMSEACKASWANTQLRADMSARAKTSCQNPETRQRRSESQKKSWTDPDIRARRIARITEARNDPQRAEARRQAALRMWEARRK